MSKTKKNLAIVGGGLGSSTTLSVFLLPMASQGIQAYIDPGTGSLIIQVLIASLLGATFTVKIFWRNIKGFFSKLFSKTRKMRWTPRSRTRS